MKKDVTAHNRKAGFDIAVEETLEAGIVLRGDEIKSIRAGRSQLTGGYVKLLHGKRREVPEVLLIGLHLSQAGQPERTKELLLHKREVAHLEEALRAKGKVAVPLKLYIRRGWAKVTVGIGTGRKQHDKRQVLKERDIAREQTRFIKGMKE